MESISFVYEDDEKLNIVGNVLVSFLEQFEKGLNQEIENPVCKLWTLHLLSLHESKLGRFKEA